MLEGKVCHNNQVSAVFPKSPSIISDYFLGTIIKGCCDECQETTMLCIFPHLTLNEHR